MRRACFLAFRLLIEHEISHRRRKDHCGPKLHGDPQMKAVAGLYYSRDESESAVATARSAGIPPEKIIVLTPGDTRRKGVLSRLLGGEDQRPTKERRSELTAAWAFEGMPSFAAVIPGVGTATAVGLLGAALLVTAGEAAEAFANTKFEDSSIEELLENEIFLYEDALRRGGSVVILIVDEAVADYWLLQFSNGGAESIDHARNQWWSARRTLERANYATLNQNFDEDEKFYRLGFEAALHARTRCKKYDQALGEMAAKLEDVQRQYPSANVDEPFTLGYERGRNYYQGLCNQCTGA